MFDAATCMSFPDNRKWAKRTAPNEGAGTAATLHAWFPRGP